MGIDVIGHKALQSHDGDRFVHQATVATPLTGMVARAATHTGEGVVLADDPHGVLEAAVTDAGDVALGALPGGTTILAGGDAHFVNNKGVGHSLGEGAIDDFAIRQPQVELVGYLTGTHHGT